MQPEPLARLGDLGNAAEEITRLVRLIEPLIPEVAKLLWHLNRAAANIESATEILPALAKWIGGKAGL